MASRPAAVIVGFSLALAVIGIIIAAYLAVQNLQGEAGVCVGTHSCAKVQNSEYGKILGVPVSVPGLGMYLFLALGSIAWLANIRGLRHTVTVLTFNLALLGLLFSGYLTYVEAFVIDAWCIYCIVSATLVSLLWLAWLAVLVMTARHRRASSL
jgi:uncharacterized membrane protein